jgi:hypothetical protein
VKPECVDSTVLMKVEPVTPERIDSTTYPSASIEEIPDEEMTVPEEMAPVFDTKEDIWGNYEPMVTDITTYQIQDEDILIKYLVDRMEMHLIENVSFDSPLTKDGTSKNKMKFSNKAQQFTIAGAHSEVEQKKKSFEELVPSYLHDFRDIFTKDGLNQLPPEQPGIDHHIETKPGFIPKTSKIYPYLKKNGQWSRHLLMRIRRKTLFPNRSPLKRMGSSLLAKRVENFAPVKITGTSTIGRLRTPTHFLSP